jgi:hypothetical protein
MMMMSTVTNINKQQLTKTCRNNRGGKREEEQPGLVLDDAGDSTVIVVVNNAGISSPKPSLAANVHISAGQKEKVSADN